MKKTKELILVMILLLISYSYLEIKDDLILILIPVFSLLSVNYLGKGFKYYLTALFVLFFFISSVLLYIGSKDYGGFGVISYIFFITIVIEIIIGRVRDKNGST